MKTQGVPGGTGAKFSTARQMTIQTSLRQTTATNRHHAARNLRVYLHTSYESELISKISKLNSHLRCFRCHRPGATDRLRYRILDDERSVDRAAAQFVVVGLCSSPGYKLQRWGAFPGRRRACAMHVRSGIGAQRHTRVHSHDGLVSTERLRPGGRRGKHVRGQILRYCWKLLSSAINLETLRFRCGTVFARRSSRPSFNMAHLRRSPGP